MDGVGGYIEWSGCGMGFYEREERDENIASRSLTGCYGVLLWATHSNLRSPPLECIFIIYVYHTKGERGSNGVEFYVETGTRAFFWFSSFFGFI